MKFLFGQRDCKKIKRKKIKINKKEDKLEKKKIFSVSLFFFWPSSAQPDTQY